MGLTYIQKVTEPDSAKHSAMTISLLVNIAAELHEIRLLLSDIAALSPGQADDLQKITKHAENVVASHSKDLLAGLESAYK